MAWLSSPKPWGMWMKQSPIYSTGLIRGLHQFRQFWQKFSENYSLLKEIVATPRRDNISEEKWMAILQNLQEEDVSGELIGCFQMRSCIGVVISIGFHCLGFGELLDMHHY
ncbi:hypothetical protein Goklo_025138 [Gossypium klotzschianum]|uniref:Uncharacterized protein n=1 Tax=Gossypium klotzschianum TaxID=34286 RepID=A0A7J8W7L9_9ROSI|nr:hypothetical protein [Gossypium klotzschianum]